ncbi:hypothetical protein J4573_19450 [Actinomadura barringtoniae]|uniref:Uncharacterized protein n=1 Tax=Actinomadura barringtoniae TaxID=1427535 RepID=A0A939T4C3_9ACTN|nr:hypothetical protein [Actinomadura barringtoniae]MBO2449288.1 hypothetical protein [Actinomadura barringtoniae]
MYHRFPAGGLAPSACGATSVAGMPFLGWQAVWIGVAAFTLMSMAAAVWRALPRRGR